MIKTDHVIIKMENKQKAYRPLLVGMTSVILSANCVILKWEKYTPQKKKSHNAIGTRSKNSYSLSYYQITKPISFKRKDHLFFIDNSFNPLLLFSFVIIK